MSAYTEPTHAIRRCRPDERGDILRIVNAAAEAYQGVIPADRWTIRFYFRHGFTRVPAEETAALLQRYWMIP